MDVPLHKYWGDMSPLSHRDRRPWLKLYLLTWLLTHLLSSLLEDVLVGQLKMFL